MITKKWAYYNDTDPFVCEWVRQLIKTGLIAPGEVDERDIRNVSPDDLQRFCQVHMFCGIAVWSYSLRLAGVSDETPVWTGSCPCQPFSAAGKAAGFADERHLWPTWFDLIRECRPERIFGEQVASPDALRWLDVVQDDLEGAGYAVGATDICAAGCGAPHIRQRLHFVADRLAYAPINGKRSFNGQSRESLREQEPFGGRNLFSELADTLPGGWPERWPQSGNGSVARSSLSFDVADAECLRSGSGRTGEAGRWNPVQPDRHGPVGSLDDPERLGGEWRQGISTGSVNDREDARWEQGDDGPVGAGESGPVEFGELGDPGVSGLARRSRQSRDDGPQQPTSERTGGPIGGFWANAEWIYCRDDKWRPVKSGTFPLVDGSSSRVGYCGDSGEPINSEASAEARSHRLSGYGNAIVAPLAAEFIMAYLEARKDLDAS